MSSNSNNLKEQEQSNLYNGQTSYHYNLMSQPIGMYDPNVQIYRGIPDLHQPLKLYEISNYITDISKIYDNNFSSSNNVSTFEGPLSYTSFGITKSGPAVLDILRKLLLYFVKIGLVDFKISNYKIEGRCYYEGQLASFIIEIIATPSLQNPIQIELRRSSGGIFAFDNFMCEFFQECKNNKLINPNDDKFKYCKILIPNISISKEIEPSKPLLMELLKNIDDDLSDNFNYQVAKSSASALFFNIQSEKFQQLLIEIPNVIDNFINILNTCEDVQMVYCILKILNVILPLRKINVPSNLASTIKLIEKKWKQSKIEAYGNITITKIPSQQIVIQARKCLKILKSLTIN